MSDLNVKSPPSSSISFPFKASTKEVDLNIWSQSLKITGELSVIFLIPSRQVRTGPFKIYGIITSKVNLIVGLPLALNGAVSVSLIPEISRNVIKNNKERFKRNIKFSTIITLVICIPVMLVLIFFSNEVMELLYPNAPKGAELLKLASITIVFSCLTQNISGILQGIGDSKTHLFAVFVGMILKLILNFALISNEKILEKGAIISTSVANVIIFFIMFSKLKKSLVSIEKYAKT